MVVQSDQELIDLFKNLRLEGLLLKTGYSKPLTTLCMDDQKSIISSVIDYHCMIKMKAAIDQLVEGLEAGGVYKYIQEDSEMFKAFFVPAYLH